MMRRAWMKCSWFWCFFARDGDDDGGVGEDDGDEEVVDVDVEGGGGGGGGGAQAGLNFIHAVFVQSEQESTCMTVMLVFEQVHLHKRDI